MSTAIPSQHPAVVLRSQYNHLRNLLAIAMIAVVGLSVAVVVVSSDDAPSTSDVIATGKFAPAKNPSGTTRYDGGPEEGTRGAASVSSAPVSTVAPPPSSIAASSQAEYEALRKALPTTRYDGGPEEGTRGVTSAPSVAAQANTRFDGGPEEGTRAVTSAPSVAAQADTRFDGGPEEGTRGSTQSGSDGSTSDPVPMSGARP